MSNQIGAEAMRELGRIISKQIPGLGFAVLVFELRRPGVANYISNAQRQDMILALEETLKRWKEGGTFNTPEEN
jgi:hypothetical protein